MSDLIVEPKKGKVIIDNVSYTLWEITRIGFVIDSKTLRVNSNIPYSTFIAYIKPYQLQRGLFMSVGKFVLMNDVRRRESSPKSYVCLNIEEGSATFREFDCEGDAEMFVDQYRDLL